MISYDYEDQIGKCFSPGATCREERLVKNDIFYLPILTVKKICSLAIIAAV